MTNDGSTRRNGSAALSPRVASAEKRYRMSLLLDTYGELLTEKQRDFLRSYYEEDFSFGEIAREHRVSRQAIFDSVKHGEAALENYERVLGLIRNSGRTSPARPGSGTGVPVERLSRIALELRDWLDRSGRREPKDLRELEATVSELEDLATDLRGGAGSGSVQLDGSASSSGAPETLKADLAGSAAGEGRGSRLLGDGPEID